MRLHKASQDGGSHIDVAHLWKNLYCRKRKQIGGFSYVFIVRYILQWPNTKTLKIQKKKFGAELPWLVENTTSPETNTKKDQGK